MHMTCESELDKAKLAGLSRDDFGGACQIHTAVLCRKNLSSSKKGPQIRYIKSDYLSILSRMSYTKISVKNMTVTFIAIDRPVHAKFL